MSIPSTLDQNPVVTYDASAPIPDTAKNLRMVGDVPALVASASTEILKLDLACGQSPREGFVGADLNAPDVRFRVDLTKYPWPWADDSADELHCSHYVEHIPAREVEERDLSRVGQEWRDLFLGQDHLFAFFDECYRVLKPGGSMQVIVPALQSVRAFQDPTHRRFIPAETFYYLAKEWRAMNKLDHYRVKCDFGFGVVHTMDSSMNAYHPEAAARKLKENWNVIYDWVVTMKSKKGEK